MQKDARVAAASVSCHYHLRSSPGVTRYTPAQNTHRKPQLRLLTKDKRDRELTNALHAYMQYTVRNLHQDARVCLERARFVRAHTLHGGGPALQT